MVVHGPSTGLQSISRAHGPTIHRIPERLVRAQSRGRCLQVSPNDRRFRRSLAPLQADVTGGCRIMPGPRTTKRCEVNTKPLPARHIAVNRYLRALSMQTRCRTCCRDMASIQATVSFRLYTMMWPVSVRVMAVSAMHDKAGDQIYEKN